MGMNLGKVLIYVRSKLGQPYSSEGQYCLSLRIRQLSAGDPLEPAYEAAVTLPAPKDAAPTANALRAAVLLSLFLTDRGRPITARAAEALERFERLKEAELVTVVARNLNRLARLDNVKVLQTCARAATRIREKYGRLIGGEYASALRRAFDGPINGDAPVLCVKWWRNGEWATRFDALAQGGFGVSTQSADSAKALTLTWPPGSGVSPFDVGGQAPLNRCIEFPDLDEDNILHEMHHWLTHENFRLAKSKISNGSVHNIVNEGTTEWLKRQLTGIEDGGYKNIMPTFNAWVQNKDIDPEKLMAAYFRGEPRLVAEVIEKLGSLGLAWMMAGAEDGPSQHKKRMEDGKLKAPRIKLNAKKVLLLGTNPLIPGEKNNTKPLQENHANFALFYYLNHSTEAELKQAHQWSDELVKKVRESVIGW